MKLLLYYSQESSGEIITICANGDVSESGTIRVNTCSELNLVIIGGTTSKNEFFQIDLCIQGYGNAQEVSIEHIRVDKDVVCIGDQVRVTPTILGCGACTYEWYNSQNDLIGSEEILRTTIQDSSDGIFILYLYYGDGCFVVEVAGVSVLDQSFELFPDPLFTLCKADSISFSLPTRVDDIHFEWSGQGVSNNEFTLLAAEEGVYNISCETVNSDCNYTQTTSIVIVEPAEPLQLGNLDLCQSQDTIFFVDVIGEDLPPGRWVGGENIKFLYTTENGRGVDLINSEVGTYQLQYLQNEFVNSERCPYAEITVNIYDKYAYDIGITDYQFKTKRGCIGQTRNDARIRDSEAFVVKNMRIGKPYFFDFCEEYSEDVFAAKITVLEYNSLTEEVGSSLTTVEDCRARFMIEEGSAYDDVLIIVSDLNQCLPISKQLENGIPKFGCIIKIGRDLDDGNEDNLYSNIETSEISGHIYPNPVNDYLHIDANMSDYEVTLLDLYGNIVLTAYNDKLLDMNFIKDDIYILIINDIHTREQIIQKIVVLR